MDGPQQPARPIPAQKKAYFSTTRWDLVCAAVDTGSPDAERALEQLCTRYWYPLYVFVRRVGYCAADAEDLTQEFFARLLTRRYLARAEPARGRFRSYLLAGIKNLLSDERDRALRMKRGGGQTPVSFGQEAAEARYLNDPAVQDTPELAFERAWTATLLERAAARLRAEYEAVGKGRQFDQLTEFRLDSAGQPSYRAAADALEMSESALKSAILRLRRRHHQLVREELADTVGDPAEVDEEIRHLLTVVGR